MADEYLHVSALSGKNLKHADIKCSPKGYKKLMSVKIRLRRDGAKKRPFYHVVAADSRRARDGRYIEELGYYNPIVAADAEPILVLKEDRIRYWLSVGAQPSDTTAALLKKKGLLEVTPASLKYAHRIATAKKSTVSAEADAPAAEASNAS